MCARFSRAVDYDAIVERFGVTFDAGRLPPRYNVAPTDEVPVITAGADGKRLEPMRWGLHARSARTRAGDKIINLRVESLVKGSFRSALLKRRCLVPAD